MTTLDQRRAQHAWNAVEQAVKLKKEDDKKTFARETKKLPIRIKTAGLGQALAFLQKKDDNNQKAQHLLFDQLGNWVLEERRLATDQSGLIEAIINGDADLLRRATEETLLYLQWLTRFAEAKIGTDDD